MENNAVRKNRYDLEDRTRKFAVAVRVFVKNIPKTILNQEDIKQLLRASGSVGANYIEANEAISKKDFIHRIKIYRKESKESGYWLRILFVGDNQIWATERDSLIQESLELTKIFGKIIYNHAWKEKE